MFEGLFQVVTTFVALLFGIALGFWLKGSKQKQAREYEEFKEREDTAPEMEIMEDEPITEEPVQAEPEPKPEEKSKGVEEDDMDKRSEKTA